MGAKKNNKGQPSRERMRDLYVNKILALLVGRVLHRKQTIMDLVRIIDSTIYHEVKLTDLKVGRLDRVRRRFVKAPETFSGPVKLAWYTECEQSHFMCSGGKFDTLIAYWLHAELRSKFTFIIGDDYNSYAYKDPRLEDAYCVYYRVCDVDFYVEINCKGTYPLFLLSGDAFKGSGSRKMPTVSYESYETDREFEF